MTRFHKTWAVMLLVIALGPVSSALLIFSVQENGPNLEFNITGSLDLTGLTLLGSSNLVPRVATGPGNTEIHSSVAGGTTTVDRYGFELNPLDASHSAAGPITGLLNVGWTGDVGFGFITSIDQIRVPQGYSGGVVSASIVENGADFSKYSFIEGIYDITLPNDTLRLQIGSPTVPEPSTYLLLSLLGLGFLFYRRRESS